ncbi:MAG: hypothetical protein JWO92_492 [Chitinophagaceae bacterium]|nr:hypothetical protein [Chitinophagaceae bacterium]
MAKPEEIFAKIFQLTTEKKINWQATNSPQVFAATVGDHRVIFTNTGASKVLQMRDKSTNETVLSLTNNRQGISFNFDALWDLIKRQVLKLDEKIDKLWDDLNKVQ